MNTLITVTTERYFRKGRACSPSALRLETTTTPLPIYRDRPNSIAAGSEKTTGSQSSINYSIIRIRSLFGLFAMAMLIAIQPLGAVGWNARHGLTQDGFSDLNQSLTSSSGYRLISLQGYESGDQARFAAIWEKVTGPNRLVQPHMTSVGFNSADSVYRQNGYAPVAITAHNVGSTTYFSGIWEYDPQAITDTSINLTYSEWVSEKSSRASQDFTAVFLHAYASGTQERFAVIWRKNDSATYATRTSKTSDEYKDSFDYLTGLGYRLVTVSGSSINGQRRYTSIWKKTSGPTWYSSHGLSQANYQAEVTNWEYQGYRPMEVTAFGAGSQRRFNLIVQRNGGMNGANLDLINDTIEDYMDNFQIPGLSLAISKEGRLVYAKGFGQADIEENHFVHPDHRFRIASVSKPITAAAVLKLVDHCSLNLDDTVFGNNGVLGNRFGTADYHPLEERITVRQLLDHTTGWMIDGVWPAAGSDPDTVVDWQLDNHTPVAEPGTLYRYMNADYVTAGRVIERRSSKSYEQFVKDEILAPLFVSQMEIGGNSLAARKSNEVVYYNGDPYGLDMNRMDANGGWIARPMDLLLFMRGIDGDTSQADILSAASINAMRTTSMAPNVDNDGQPTNYGLGFSFNGNVLTHNGGMDGTLSTLVYRISDGMAFSVTCNSRPATDKFANQLRSAVWSFLNSITTANAWPSYDLFPCNLGAGDPVLEMAEPRHFYVDGNSNCFFPNGRKECSLLGGPFQSVNQAVAVICNGDELFIRNGSYAESVVFGQRAMIHSYDGTAVIGD